MSKTFFCKALLVIVAVFVLTVFSSVLLAQGPGDEPFERAKAAQEKHSPRLLAIDGIVGTAVGFNREDNPVIKVFTARPAVAGIPKKLDGVPVHVLVTGKFYAVPGQPEGKRPKKPKEPVDRTARFDRPVPIGVSTGHPDITAGTITCRVTDGNNVYALSNNHVYADENKASIDDNVLQPGRVDGGVNPTDAIGTLYDFEWINFGDANNTIDAAIAISSTELLGNATPDDGYGTPSSTTEAAYVNQRVQKYGRTTGLTKGQVWAVNWTGNVIYSTGTARFVNQIMVYNGKGGFIGPGDSGSLLVSARHGKMPVGLLFAGNQTGTYAIANPIDIVLETFGVTIDGQ